MRQVLLIARREYLAYVRAWGFWASLLLAPLLIAAIIAAPILVRQAEPPRAIVVVGSDPALVAAVSATLAGSGGAGGGRKADTGFVVIAAPAPNIDLLAPYLTGQREVQLADGQPVGLTAAIDVGRDGQGKPRADIWSQSLSDFSLFRVVDRALTEMARRELAASLGVAANTQSALETVSVEISEKDPRRMAVPGVSAEVTTRDRMPFLVAALLGFVLFSTILGVASMLLSGVIEEKSSRVLDTLLTSVQPTTILLGKLLGVAGVSLTLLGSWSLIGVLAGQWALGAFMVASPAAAAAGGESVGIGMLSGFLSALASPQLLVIFAASFIIGYVMFGALFLALGSLCDTVQESQAFMSPLMILLTGPMLLLPLALENPASSALEAASWIPLYAPILVILRAPADPPILSLVGPLLLAALCAGVMLWAAAGVFKAGASRQASMEALRTRLFSRAKRAS